MILGSGQLGTQSAQLGAGAPSSGGPTSPAVLGRIIDLVGRYIPTIDIVGEVV